MPEVDIALDEEIKTKTKKPNFYKVIIHNDDSTPIDWVIQLLMTVFRHNEDNAWEITMQVHHQGSGVAGVYTYEIASEKVQESVIASRDHGYPLEVSLDVDSDNND